VDGVLSKATALAQDREVRWRSLKTRLVALGAPGLVAGG